MVSNISPADKPEHVMVLDVFRRLQAVNLDVTYEALSAHLPRFSVSTVRNYCRELEDAGLVVRGGRTKRSYRLADTTSPGSPDEAANPAAASH